MVGVRVRSTTIRAERVMTRTETAVMAALTRRGHYPETPDGFRDAIVHAQDIVAAYRESDGGPTAVAIAVSRAVHPRYVGWTEATTRCFHADQDAVWDAIRQAERDVA